MVRPNPTAQVPHRLFDLAKITFGTSTRSYLLKADGLPAAPPPSRPAAASTAQEKRKLLWAGDVAEGLLHVHKKGFLHRDLATRNVLVGSDMRCMRCRRVMGPAALRER